MIFYKTMWIIYGNILRPNNMVYIHVDMEKKKN